MLARKSREEAQTDQCKSIRFLPSAADAATSILAFAFSCVCVVTNIAYSISGDKLFIRFVCLFSNIGEF